VTLNNLNSTRATLEDVFLARTGRSYEGDDAPETAEDVAPAKRVRRSRAA